MLIRPERLKPGDALAAIFPIKRRGCASPPKYTFGKVERTTQQ